MLRSIKIKHTDSSQFGNTFFSVKAGTLRCAGNVSELLSKHRSILSNRLPRLLFIILINYRASVTPTSASPFEMLHSFLPVHFFERLLEACIHHKGSTLTRPQETPSRKHCDLLYLVTSVVPISQSKNAGTHSSSGGNHSNGRCQQHTRGQPSHARPPLVTSKSPSKSLKSIMSCQAARAHMQALLCRVPSLAYSTVAD